MQKVYAIALSLIVGLVLSVSGALVSVQAQDAASSKPAAEAQQDGASSTVSLALAEAIIAGAKAKAEAEGWAMSFAVVDNFGRPVAMVRMDGTRWMTPKVAHSKAFTAASFGRPSASVDELAKNRKQLFKSVEEIMGEPLLPAGGGLPILMSGKLLGGVGASGGTEAQDIEAAQAGLNAIGAD